MVIAVRTDTERVGCDAARFRAERRPGQECETESTTDHARRGIDGGRVVGHAGRRIGRCRDRRSPRPAARSPTAETGVAATRHARRRRARHRRRLHRDAMAGGGSPSAIANSDQKRNPLSDEMGSRETVLEHAPISPRLSPPGSPPNVREYLACLPLLRKRTSPSSCSRQERPSVFPRPFRLSATMPDGSRLPGIPVPFFAVRRIFDNPSPKKRPIGWRSRSLRMMRRRPERLPAGKGLPDRGGTCHEASRMAAAG